MTKAALRARMRALRATATGTAELSHWLAEEPRWPAARTVAGYAAWRGEIPVDAVLAEARARGVRVVLPVVAGESLTMRVDEGRRPGWRGIEEPDGGVVVPEEIDVWLIPGLAFDAAGHRLGQGGGHYDRTLRGDGLRIGVAWSFQVVDAVPVEPFDQGMHRVLTERGWVR